MKKIGALLSVLVLFTTITGCKKVIDKIFDGFDADVPAIEVKLPIIPLAPPQEIQIGSFTQRFNLDSTIKANSDNTFGAGDVKSIKVKSIQFSLLDADANNNVSNFESARFTFHSNANATPVQIASVNFPDVYATSFTYTSDANAPELKDYLKGNELTYTVFGKIRRTTSKTLPLSIQVTLTVK